MDNTLCPLCRNLLRITETHTEVEGDSSSATETRVYTVQTLSCRSKSCANYGKPVAENRLLIYPAQTETAPGSETEPET